MICTIPVDRKCNTRNVDMQRLWVLLAAALMIMSVTEVVFAERALKDIPNLMPVNVAQFSNMQTDSLAYFYMLC